MYTIVRYGTPLIKIPKSMLVAPHHWRITQQPVLILSCVHLCTQTWTAWVELIWLYWRARVYMETNTIVIRPWRPQLILDCYDNDTIVLLRKCRCESIYYNSKLDRYNLINLDFIHLQQYKQFRPGRPDFSQLSRGLWNLWSCDSNSDLSLTNTIRPCKSLPRVTLLPLYILM